MGLLQEKRWTCPMRTFPRALAKFRRIVDERGRRLRQKTFAQLKQLANESSERITVESRSATIETIVLPLASGGLQVVARGFLEHRLMPGKSVAMDGFCKHPDETITPMTDREFRDFD